VSGRNKDIWANRSHSKDKGWSHQELRGQKRRAVCWVQLLF